jgi:hypothetical protein
LPFLRAGVQNSWLEATMQPPLDDRALDIHEITPAEVTRRLSLQLRKMIGTGRRWSYRGVAQVTGIDERSLKAYAAGTACPNLAKYKRLLVVLGPELSRDIDRMYGWMPRNEASQPGSLDLTALRSELLGKLQLIDAVLSEPAPRPRQVRHRRRRLP